MTDASPKVLIVGLGSIGRRHLRNLRQVAPGLTIGVWRQQHTQRPDDECARLADAWFFSEASALAWGPTAALVCNPAPFHTATALALARAGVHLFIEKPLAASLAGIDDLMALYRERRLTLLPGYCFRHHALLRRLKELVHAEAVGKVLGIRAEVGQYLPDWRPDTDYREGVSAKAALGGGALLELSHELDYVQWLGGPVAAVTALARRVSALEIETEDLAEVTLDFAGGAIGQAHMDMLQRTPSRSCKVIGSEGTLVLDFIRGELREFRPGDGEGRVHAAPPDAPGMYVAELRHFLDCLAGAATPCVTVAEARRVLEIVLAAQQSAAVEMQRRHSRSILKLSRERRWRLTLRIRASIRLALRQDDTGGPCTLPP